MKRKEILGHIDLTEVKKDQHLTNTKKKSSKGVAEGIPPGSAATPQPGKVQKINADGTAEIVDPKGTVTKVNQKDITPDAKDPNKLAVNVPKPKLQPGAAVSMTSEDLKMIKKLAGLK